MDNFKNNIIYILGVVLILVLIVVLLKASLYIGAVVLGIYLIRKIYIIIKSWIVEKNNKIKKKKFQKELEEMRENKDTLTFMEAEIVREPVKFQNGNENETIDKVIDVDYKEIE